MLRWLTIYLSIFFIPPMLYAEDINYSAPWGLFTHVPIARYKTAEIPLNKGYLQSSLRYLSEFDQQSHAVNKFCVIGYAYHQQDKLEKGQWLVYWLNTQQLIRWELPSAENNKDLNTVKDSLIFAKPYIDLRSLVPLAEPLHMADWEEKGVMQVIQDCIAHGDSILIKSLRK
ncbi:hypothetical protein VQ643_01655 [Pseudomonas sp. F1_0610]|uniref:hypothetical protein n=1 Tax=Pseudomonas sp. F1_0610 TaxID=3114284 RepID=UPI0039C03ABB